MIDRSRSRGIARDARGQAEQLRKLAEMPDRAKADDFKAAAKTMLSAAGVIDELVDANLPGCVCETVQTDNYGYLDYAESCRHHGGLFRQMAELKQSYERTEKKLKDETRMSIVHAALSGVANMPATGADLESFVVRAVAVADATIRLITEKK